MIKYSILILISIIGGCNNRTSDELYVARVNDRKLTLDLLEEKIPYNLSDEVEKNTKKEFIYQWIDSEVLYNEAIRLKLDRSPDYEQQLEDVKKEILINNLIEYKIDSEKIAISEEDARKFYDNNREMFIRSEADISAIHILVPTRERANYLRRQLRRGISFDQLFENINSATEKADTIRNMTRNELIPELKKPAFSLTIGNNAGPIKSNYGYHFIKIIDKNEQGTYRGFNAVRNQVVRMLSVSIRKKKYEDYLKNLKSKLIIENHWTDFFENPDDSLNLSLD